MDIQKQIDELKEQLSQSDSINDSRIDSINKNAEHFLTWLNKLEARIEELENQIKKPSNKSFLDVNQIGSTKERDMIKAPLEGTIYINVEEKEYQTWTGTEWVCVSKIL